LLGTRVEPKDEVKLDGRRVRLVPESLVNRKILMYHKPEGEVTTRKDPEGRPTVFDRLPPMRGSRWVAIGRLDLNTSGLLIFTNDGEMANRLMHPSHEVEREYAVRILGELKPAQRKQLLEGVVLEDGLAKFNSIESRGGSGTNRWYHVTLSEGRTREVRRMFESLQLVVSRLIRVRYGPVALDPLLKQGMNRLLNLEETNRLCEAVGVEPQAPRAERRRDYQQTRRSDQSEGYGDEDFAMAGGEATPERARKSRIIGSKADELPTDRVERAAELLRRRRAAESAGVEFSGRSGRLSGKRTLRESELKRIAEEKAAAKAKRPAAPGAERSDGDDRAAPRTRAAVGARSRSSAATATTTIRGKAPAAAARSSTARPSTARASATRTSTTRTSTTRTSEARAPSTRSATTRVSTTRTGLARTTSYAARDEEAVAPRRAPRAGTRSSSGSEDEAPRRRTTNKPVASRTGTSARSSRATTSERPARARSADSERPARSRAGVASSERPERASSPQSARTASSKPPSTRSAAGPRSAGAISRSAGATRGAATTSRSASAPRAQASASRSKPGAKTARSGTAASKSARSTSRPAAAPRSGGSRAGSKPAGKGKRTR